MPRFTALVMFLFGFLFGLILLPAASLFAGGADVHDPATELESFQMMEGFEINLFADETMGVVNPIQAAWDPRGRLWVVCAPSYPHAYPRVEPDDHILILEDTDGDGRADRHTIFAGGLYIPTGLELGDGGVYVANAPDLLFLKDTDGDDRADHREVVFTGFGTEDSHHSISAFRWGPGGFLYFQEGTFFHSQIETAHGTVRLVYGGVFKFHPKTRHLDVFADVRYSNPWGHLIDRWGQAVLVDNARIHYLAPETANSQGKLDGMPVRGTSRGKTCGGDFLSGRHLPEELVGQFYLGSYQAHGVSAYQSVEEGSGYRFDDETWLMNSKSDYFRPVDVKMGPDGAIYIVDWYNPIIGHVQHEIRDARRDQSHGRIWRVRHSTRPLVSRPRLLGVPLPELLDHLRDPEEWTRYQVRRVISDMEPEVVAKALGPWLSGLDHEEEEFEHHRLEALWCYQTIGRIEEPLLRAVLKSHDHRARRAALRVLRYWWPSVARPLELLETAVSDSHPQVRLEALLTLGFIPDPGSVTIATRVLDKPMDAFLEKTLRLTIDGLRPAFVPHLDSLEFQRESHRLRALVGLNSTLAIEPLLMALKSADFSGANLDELVQPVAERAGQEELTRVWAALADVDQEERLEPEAIVAVLGALEKAARDRRVKPDGSMRNLHKLNPFLIYRSSLVRIAALRLSAVWSSRPQSKELVGLMTASGSDPAIGRFAAEALARTSRSLVKDVRGLLRENQPIQLQYLAVYAMAVANEDGASTAAAKVFARDPGAADPRWIVAEFLRRDGGAKRLGEALEKTTPHGTTRQRIRQYLNERGEQDPTLVAAVNDPDQGTPLVERLLAEGVTSLLADVEAHGDARRGAEVFRDPRLACFSCHTIGTEGRLIGPDLAAIGTNTGDYIVESILVPSKTIKEQFENVVVIRNDGTIVTGILTYDDTEKVIVRSAEDGKEVTVPREEVQVLQQLPSLMPIGLANNLERQEFLDLVRYLTELGKDTGKP